MSTTFQAQRGLAPSIPNALIEVALIDARTCAATGGMGVSWWLQRVAAGEAPAPVIQQPRMTRWRLADVRAFWAAQAERPLTSTRAVSDPGAVGEGGSDVQPSKSMRSKG